MLGQRDRFCLLPDEGSADTDCSRAASIDANTGLADPRAVLTAPRHPDSQCCFAAIETSSSADDLATRFDGLRDAGDGRSACCACIAVSALFGDLGLHLG